MSRSTAHATPRNLKTRICLELQNVSIFNGDPFVALQVMFLLKKKLSRLSHNSRLDALMDNPDHRIECDKFFCATVFG